LLRAAWLIVSAIFLALAFFQHDYAWGIVAYGILFWLACAAIRAACLYTQAFRGIIAKYDEKMRELTAPKA